jgi:hypothetical protein
LQNSGQRFFWGFGIPFFGITGDGWQAQRRHSGGMSLCGKPSSEKYYFWFRLGSVRPGYLRLDKDMMCGKPSSVKYNFWFRLGSVRLDYLRLDKDMMCGKLPSENKN